MAVFCSYFLMLALLCVIIWIIVPQFITSIRDFGDNIMLYYNNVMKFLNSSRGEQILKFLEDNDINPAMLRTKLMSLTTYIPDAVGTLSTWASGLIGGVIDFFIGLIFSVYVLAARNKLRSQGRADSAAFPARKTLSPAVSLRQTDLFHLLQLYQRSAVRCVHSGRADLLCHEHRRAGIPHDDRRYHRHHQHDPLCGTLDGYDSLCADPADGEPGSCHRLCHYRYHCTADRQQSDLSRVVGTSVGLPAIWVLFAITVGGGLFGVLGMIVGVPVMSIIYTVMREKTASGTPNQPASRKRKSTAGTSGSRCRPFTAGRQSEKTAKTTTAILRSERFRREKNEPVSAETGFFVLATKIRQNSTKYISYLNRFDKTNLAIMLNFRC